MGRAAPVNTPHISAGEASAGTASMPNCRREHHPDPDNRLVDHRNGRHLALHARSAKSRFRTLRVLYSPLRIDSGAVTRPGALYSAQIAMPLTP